MNLRKDHYRFWRDSLAVTGCGAIFYCMPSYPVSRPGGESVELMKSRARSGHVRSPVSEYLFVLGATHGDGLQSRVRDSPGRQVSRVGSANRALVCVEPTAPPRSSPGTCALAPPGLGESSTLRGSKSRMLCDRPRRPRPLHHWWGAAFAFSLRNLFDLT